MGAKMDLPQDACGLAHGLVPSEDVSPAAADGQDAWTETPGAPPSRGERRAHAVFQFGLQGVLLLAVAAVVVVPLMVVPSCSAKAWPILKTILLMDVLAYLILAGGLIAMVERHLHSASRGA